LTYIALQSLEIYDQHGHALHKPAEGAFKTWDGRIPAEKQRVIEYLVLEKRMWYDGPWLIREQVWDVDAKKTD
jgi:protein MBA1